MGVFRISNFLTNPLQRKNCHNSRTSNDIDVNFGLVTKLEKKNTVISKTSGDGVISKFVTSLPFFGFMTNLEQFGSRSPDV